MTIVNYRPGVMDTNKGIIAGKRGQVNVVFDDHNIAYFVRVVECSSSVCGYEHLDAQAGHDPHRQGQL